MYLSNDFAGATLLAERGRDIESIRDNILAGLSLQQPSTPDREVWDQRLQGFLRLQALRQADRRLGPLHDANNIEDIERRCLEERYGKHYRPRTEGEAQSNTHWQRFKEAQREAEAAWEAHDSLIGDRYDNALVELVRTPAPDVFALRLKVELMAEREMTDEWVGCDIKKLISDDVERLEGGELA